MSHSINLGQTNLIKSSKSGVCRANNIIITGSGIQKGRIVVPDRKLWIIQQLSIWNGETGPRSGYFIIENEVVGQLVSFLSMDKDSKWTCKPNDSITFIGTGMQYIPNNWQIVVQINGMDNSGNIIFYYHVSEIDLD